MPARPPGGAGLPPACCLLPACSRRLGLWWRAGTDRHQALSAYSDSVPARRAAKWRRWVPGWGICPAGFWAPSPCLYPTNVPLLCLKSAWRGTWRGGGGRGKRLSHVRITSNTTLLYFFRSVSTRLAKFSVPRVCVAPGRWRSPLGEGGGKRSGAPPRRALLLLPRSIPLNFSESFAATRPGHRLSPFPCVGVMFEPGSTRQTCLF